MAPRNWSGGDNDGTGLQWCDALFDIFGAASTAVGTGAANTIAMDANCSSGAGQAASDYSGGGLTDWFLPSKDELNAMCNYSRNPTTLEVPTDTCYLTVGTPQDGTFASSGYGFTDFSYWSSSQLNATDARYQRLGDGEQAEDVKEEPFLVRPVRAF
jgi:hypothetical protein